MRGGKEAIMRAREEAEERRDELLARQELRLTKLRILAKRKVIEAGLSQAAFARRAGVSPATVSLWFNGETELEPGTLVKVCGALHNLRPHAAMTAVLAEAEAEALTATG